MTEITTERLVEAVARGIWIADGGVPRIYDQQARPGSEFWHDKQTCMRHARAALAAIAREAGGAAELDAAAVAVETLADEPLAAALLRALAGAEGNSHD